MKYFTQFDESNQVIGTNLVGWTVEVGGTPGRAPDIGDVPIKRRYLPLTTQTAATNTLLSWDAIDGDANRDKFDLLTCCVLPLTTVDENVALFARQSSGISNAYLGVLTLTGGLSIYKVVAGAGSTVASAGFTVDPSKSYFLRFNGNGTSLKLKAWDAALGMAGEPAAWNITTTDPSLTAAGNVGMQCFDAAGTGEVAAFNFFSVGTNGDTAPCPRTNAEFYDWANKPNQRCIIAELQATGYNSGASPYTKTVNAYVSNLGYTSQQQDTPSLKHYDNYISTVPTFSRNMGEALTGPSQVGFGELVLKNPTYANSGAGRLDDWIRARWNRNYLRMFVGSRDWPRHDFRPIVTGRLGIPSAPSPELIRFPIADLSDFFNAPLATLKFTADEFVDQLKPKIYGMPRCVELQVDTTTKIATLNDGAMNDGNDRTYKIFDATSNGFTHIGGTKSNSLTISAVNTATDTITSSIPHNLQAGYRVQFYNFTLPTPLATSTNYWVLAAGLTANDFKVTATKGSTTPVDLTSATTGARICSYGYTFDPAGGTVEFVNLPAGRAVCFGLSSPLGGTATQTIRDIAFTTAGLSLNFKDSASFTAALASDTSFGEFVTRIGQAATCRDAIDDVARRCRVWYGFSADGLLQTGAIALPGSTAVRSFTSSDVKLAGVSLTKIDRPIDFTRSVVYGAGAWYLLGPPTQVPGIKLNGGDDYGQTSAELFSAGRTAYGGLSYGAAGIPLDDHPDQTDSNTTAVFDTYNGDVSALLAFYKWPMGFFEIKTKFGALWTTSRPLALGDTISLEYARLGWKNYTGSDDLSPDNTGDYDARLAVVRGIAVNLAAPPDEQVVLQVYRPIRGYYPAADFN